MDGGRKGDSTTLPLDTSRGLSHHGRRLRAALVFISNDWPRPAGGPTGIAYILVQAARRDLSANKHIYVVGGGFCAPMADVNLDVHGPNTHSVSSRRLARHSRQFLACIRLLSQYDRIYFLQFGTSRSAMLLRLIAPIVGKSASFVYSEHSRGGIHLEMRRAGRPWLVRAFRRLDLYLTMRVASAIIWPSQAALENFISHNRWKWLRGKSHIVHSAIPVPSADRTVPSIVKSEIRIVTVARTVPEKNVPSVVRAVIALQEAGYSNLRLTLIGSPGSDQSIVRSLVPKASAGSIQCLGEIPNDACHRVLCDSDIFVLVPEVAVFDLSLLEAMGHSLAIVSSRVGGNIEALGEDYPGLVEGSDELYKTLRRLVDDAELRRALGARNYLRYCERFSATSRMLDAYLRVAMR